MTVGRVALRAAATTAGLVAAAHWVPSTVSLGQWLPLQALPGEWCRWRGDPSGANVAITFDDGPDPEHTPPLLQRLDQLGWPATFFCLGEQVRRHPELVGELSIRGHQVETHGDRHDHHLWRSPGWVGRDLDAALATMRDVRVHPRWFRPPFGQASGASLYQARRRHLQPVLWSAWGREWIEPTAEDVTRRVVAGLRPGAVVLLHDSDASSPPGSAAKALQALNGIAAELARQHLTAVTLDQLVDG